MIRAEWIQTLSEASKLGSFNAVALSRGVSGVAISKQIASLEDYIGESVFSRSTRPLSLTETGRVLLEKSRSLLQEHIVITDWLNERQLEPSGVVKIVGLEERVLDFTLVPWVGEFTEKYPKISLELNLVADLNQLLNTPADVYWGLGEPLGKLAPGLRRKKTHQTRFGIFASQSYLEKYGIPKSPEDLKNHFVIGHVNNTPNNFLIVKGGPAKKGDLSVSYLQTKVVTVSGALKLAEQGLGLVNCAESLANLDQTWRQRKLIPVLQEYWHDDAVAYAYYHQVRIEQPKVRAFLDYFSEKALNLADNYPTWLNGSDQPS